MGQIQFITSLVLIGLFTIALVSFAINFAEDNGTTISLEDDSDYPSIKDNIEADIDVFYSNANTSSEAMYKSTISSQTEATEGGTAFKVGPSTALSMVQKSIRTAYTKIFGSDSGFGIFLTAFLSLLGFISVLYIYKAWAGRNPD